MGFEVFQKRAFNSKFIPIAYCQVRVTDEQTGELVQLYDDISGTPRLGNPITADGNGYYRFYLQTGRRYRIVESKTITSLFRLRYGLPFSHNEVLRDVSVSVPDVTRDSLGLDTDDSPQFAALNIGHESDTTLSRPDAGRLQIEGREVITAPASATQLTTTIAELNSLSGITRVGDVVHNQAFNPDGSFTSGTGWLTAIKIGASNYLVTFTALSAWGHSSASAVSTSTGIPATYRPTGFIEVNYTFSVSALRRARVGSDGLITVEYRNWAGDLANATSTGQGFTLSWIV